MWRVFITSSCSSRVAICWLKNGRFLRSDIKGYIMTRTSSHEQLFVRYRPNQTWVKQWILHWVSFAINNVSLDIHQDLNDSLLSVVMKNNAAQVGVLIVTVSDPKRCNKFIHQVSRCTWQKTFSVSAIINHLRQGHMIKSDLKVNDVTIY